MAGGDDYLKMNNDDWRATRIFTLAVKFFNARSPLSSSEIARELYPDLDLDSFRRQYLRDRNVLAGLGLAIREVGDRGTDAFWEVDGQTSYVQGAGLSARDAQLLYVLCHDLISDPSFAYRNELRIALAKVSRLFKGAIPLAAFREPAATRRMLSQLVASMDGRHAVRVEYTDAKGVTSTRTLALLGHFGLRDRTYFVASRVERDGTLVEGSVRTYRLDRFGSVRELAGVSYEVPQDFFVGDYARLPFQMGDEQGTAQIVLSEDDGHDVARAVSLDGTIENHGGRRIWNVPYADIAAVASWCVGAGLVPSAPAELVESYRAVLASARTTPVDEALAARLPEAHPTPRRRAGRTGSIDLVRQMVTLAGSLTEAGEPVTAEHIAQTFGIEVEQAKHVILLITMGSGESLDYLPVMLSDDGDVVTLMEGAQASARQVRLTRSETNALSAALAEVGVPADDPLAQQLADAYAAPSFSRGDVEQSLGEPEAAGMGAVLRTCSQAIAQRRTIAFAYRPVSGGDVSQRSVVPQLLRRSGGSWYLDGYDLVRQAPRVFRVDRMGETTVAGAAPEVPDWTAQTTRRLVTVRFVDPCYLDLFHWERLEVLAREGEAVIARLPDYGGSWLVRHLAACAGTVAVSDPELASRVRAYAARLGM